MISRVSRRCKLEVEGKIFHNVMTFTYLGINITSDRNVNRYKKADDRSIAIERMPKVNYLEESMQSNIRVY